MDKGILEDLFGPVVLNPQLMMACLLFRLLRIYATNHINKSFLDARIGKLKPMRGHSWIALGRFCSLLQLWSIKFNNKLSNQPSCVSGVLDFRGCIHAPHNVVRPRNPHLSQVHRDFWVKIFKAWALFL